MQSVEADFVIVGAGSAGCVLANRLSADPTARVILIEAGSSDRQLMVKMPMGMAELMKPGPLNWGFETEPEPHLNGRKLYVPRGRVVGGSSSINGMVFVRGHPSDFDRWPKGWSFDEVLPYFRKLENFHGATDAFRAKGGPLDVVRPKLTAPLDLALQGAARERKLGESADFNGASQDGFGVFDHTIVAGARVSSATAYLKPALGRPNLTVLSGSLAHRILIENGRATGVALGNGEIVRASRDVIVSAGAIQSPQLLQVSGIGDRDRLCAAGIEALHHLPGVGRNLKNHPDMFIQHQCLKPVTLMPTARMPGKAMAGARWLLTRSGVVASNNWLAGAYLRTSRAKAAPDIQLMMSPFALKLGTFDVTPWHGFQLHIGHETPESTGFVEARSLDIRDRPRILYNYLASEPDRVAAREGVKMTREILATRAFNELRGEETFPGPGIKTDSEIDQWLRANLDTAYHPTSSCRMGDVVDAECRVIGIEALRVVDASVMPDIVNANTHAAIVMLAEKASDQILGRPPLPPAKRGSDVPLDHGTNRSPAG